MTLYFKSILVSFFILLLCISTTSIAQFKKKEKKLTNKELRSKAIKEAKKYIKILNKVGYLELPGDQTLSEQVIETYISKYEIDEKSYPKYLVSILEVNDMSFSAAKRKAYQLIYDDILYQMDSIVTKSFKFNVQNDSIIKNIEIQTRIQNYQFNADSFKLGRPSPIALLMKNNEEEVLLVLSARYSYDECYQMIVQDFIQQLPENILIQEEEKIALTKKQPL
ncbi:hypothetical protein [Flammeovirga pacifica]|uniref:Uncharacterized protein n=1 Tax=Flammeovirga pacifica TaxID=915059 RepID=A0A1S1YXE2_FLAPC|nr:hypothetical protein [Flammeovirga pacifica]OHX65689.1 hypothetical protein NH26_04660 [Flammeovirga pacifica]